MLPGVLRCLEYYCTLSYSYKICFSLITESQELDWPVSTGRSTRWSCRSEENYSQAESAGSGSAAWISWIRMRALVHCRLDVCATLGWGRARPAAERCLRQRWSVESPAGRLSCRPTVAGGLRRAAGMCVLDHWTSCWPVPVPGLSGASRELRRGVGSLERRRRLPVRARSISLPAVACACLSGAGGADVCLPVCTGSISFPAEACLPVRPELEERRLAGSISWPAGRRSRRRSGRCGID